MLADVDKDTGKLLWNEMDLGEGRSKQYHIGISHLGLITEQLS